MPSIRLGQRVGRSRGRVLGLNFSALTALPVGRQSAVTTAANAAAARLGVSVQSIIDAIASSRGVFSGRPNDGCLLVSAGGALTVQGDPVGALRSWTGTLLATQADAALKPVSGATGLVFSVRKRLTGSPALTLTSGSFVGVSTGFTAGRIYNLTGTASAFHFEFFRVLGFAGTVGQVAVNPSGKVLEVLYSPTNTIAVSANGVSVGSATLGGGVFKADTELFGSDDSADTTGTLVGIHANLTSQGTVSQRAALREFFREYFGVVY